MKKIAICFLFTATVVTTKVSAQPAATISAVSPDSLSAWMKATHVPGLAIGIIENGKVKSINAYGELKPGTPTTTSSLWNVASLTKPITTMTVLSLVNKGLLNLDEPVSKYWIDPDIKDNPWTRKLTTRILLSHQSGFPNWRYGDPDKKLIFHFEPGTGMKYSGEGFEYLRKAIEAKFHKSLQQLAREELFSPLGLTDIGFGWNDALDTNRFAYPADKLGNRYDIKPRVFLNAADWLITSIAAYTRFGEYVVNGAGLQQPLYNEMTSLQGHFDTLAANRADGMGLGWEIIRDLPNGEFVQTHSGGDPGVATLILLFPISKRGIVIFTNGDNGEQLRGIILKHSQIDLAPALAKYMDEFK